MSRLTCEQVRLPQLASCFLHAQVNWSRSTEQLLVQLLNRFSRSSFAFIITVRLTKRWRGRFAAARESLASSSETLDLVQDLARLDLGYPVLDPTLTYPTNFEGFLVTGLSGNRGSDLAATLT